MVKFVQSRAWAVTADDPTQARVKRTREMRNFMTPPKFMGVVFGLTPDTGVACGLTVQHTIESACRLSVEHLTKPGLPACKISQLCLWWGSHGFRKSPVGTVRFGRKPV